MLASLPGLAAARVDETATHGLDSILRMFSPGLRQIDRRILRITQELQSLPKLPDTTWGSRYGFRSGNVANETKPEWLQLNFGQIKRVDTIVLVPVDFSTMGEKGLGYGFPKRFKIELSNNPDMKGAVTVVDRSTQDVPNPGRYPMVLRIPPTAGRYLRVTSLKHFKADRNYFWALEELMAFEGNLNVAQGSRISYSSSMSLFPLWSEFRVNDGQSALGMPVDVTEPSPSKGYLSAREKFSPEHSRLSESERKWCEVDLQQSMSIGGINILPLQADDYETVGGRGFPRSFKLQLSNDPEFKQIAWQTDRGPFPLGFPHGCAIKVEVPQVMARYVRLISTRMWSRDYKQSFGLSEIQVFSGQKNVSLGKPVLCKDKANKPKGSGWDPSYLTDGYTSLYRLVTWPVYLRNIERMTRLKNELADLTLRQLQQLRFGRHLIMSLSGALVLMVVMGWIWAMVRGKSMRRREVTRLREQIARDLHDDIGSNLAGIVLLSEIGSHHSMDDESRRDFESIRTAAQEASTSMRDIVWLIQRGPMGLKDFVTKLRQTVQVMVGHLEASIVVQPATFHDHKLSLLFRRHVFMAFKEVLNNVRKHSQAGRVEVLLEIERSWLRFRVTDNGSGFDPQATESSGYGLGNLKRRASRVSGRMQIQSRPGMGTVVSFEAPLTI